jgi:hypothetical protein
MYIDTYNFNYPILKTSVNLIKEFFARYQVRKCVLVKSQYLMGSTGIQKLISKLQHSTNANIKILNTREEGEFWCSVLNTIRNVYKDNNQT